MTEEKKDVKVPAKFEKLVQYSKISSSDSVLEAIKETQHKQQEQIKQQRCRIDSEQ